MAHPEELYADTGAPICAIPIAVAFSGLTEPEKLYAHHMCRASFHGTRIVLQQTSAESEAIFDLISQLYHAVGGDWHRAAQLCDVDRHDVEHFLEYASMFLCNLGNYRSTGDEKFVPRISIQSLERLCQINSRTQSLFEMTKEAIYATSPCKLGYSSDDSFASGYYLGPIAISKAEVSSVQDFLKANDILSENTRISKSISKTGECSFAVHIASVDHESAWKPTIHDDLNNFPVSFEAGDFSEPLRKVVHELRQALPLASNDKQHGMIVALMECLTSGNHEAFKTAQRLWVQDRSPNVETVLGFIETYQDPHGVRGAWEGIIAIVNKEQSKKFATLVERSSEFVSTLPWNGEGAGLEQGKMSLFESSNFVKPDFTSLDTIGFVKSESPAGLNLPNFEDICQRIGSKNLEFGNVNLANPPNEVIPFVREEELAFLRKHREMAFEVLVACHELLGHGSGRLLMETGIGEYNFDIVDPPISPVTGSPIKSWYRHGETWSSVFGADANAIEESRADGISLLLITNLEVLRVFGYTHNSDIRADDIMYAGFLTFIYGAIKGLSRWDPDTRKFGESHRRGKFAILKCLVECGPDLLQLQDSCDGLQIFLNKSNLRSLAIPALRRFLLNIQVFRSTANAEEGIPFFKSYSEVDETFEKYRRHVLAQEPPRIQYVQPNTYIDDGKVVLKEYAASKEGIVQSWVERRV